mgnify:CR=1 FL=1
MQVPTQSVTSLVSIIYGHAKTSNVQTAIEKGTLPDIVQRLLNKTTFNPIMLGLAARVTDVGRIAISSGIAQFRNSLEIAKYKAILRKV